MDTKWQQYSDTHLNTSEFILSIGYWEQLQNAMNSFSHLVLLSADFNRTAAIPYVRDSILHGAPSYQDTETMHTLDLYFSLNQLIEMLTRHTNGHMETFHTFLLTSPSRIQLGLFLHDDSDAMEWLLPGEETDQLIQDLSNQETALECTQLLSESRVFSLVTALNSWNASRGRFYVHSALCIDPSLPPTTASLSRMFSSLSTGIPSSIVINQWRGITGMSDKSSKRINFKKRILKLPPWPLSEMVLAASDNYFRSENLTLPLIGLHARLEKLSTLAHSSHIPPAEFVSRCLTRVETHLEVLMARESDQSMLLLSDISLYGSQSCHQCKGGLKMLRQFNDNGYNFSEYDPSYGYGLTDAGFVSLVEMSVLSRSQFLILMGGGAFQKQLISRFYQNLGANTTSSMNNDFRLKKICTSHDN